MKVQKVLSRKQLPSSLPLWSSMTLWLLLDRYQPPGWVWGALGVLWAALWIVAVIAILRDDPVELKELQ